MAKDGGTAGLHKDKDSYIKAAHNGPKDGKKGRMPKKKGGKK